MEFLPLRDLCESFVSTAAAAEFRANLRERREKGLGDQVRALSDKCPKQASFFHHFSQDPTALVRAYNSCLDHLRACLRRRELGEVSWPPPEMAEGGAAAAAAAGGRSAAAAVNVSGGGTGWGSPPPPRNGGFTLKGTGLFPGSNGLATPYFKILSFSQKFEIKKPTLCFPL